MSGWDNAPGYGGGAPSDWPTVFYVSFFVFCVFVLAPAAWFYASKPATANCREIKSSDVGTIEREGQTKAVLDLRSLDLKPGECVVIRP